MAGDGDVVVVDDELDLEGVGHRDPRRLGVAARLRAERMRQEGGEMGDQKLGADEIVFTSPPGAGVISVRVETPGGGGYGAQAGKETGRVK